MSFTVELPMVTMFLAPMRSGDTPVPIPNTTVKTWTADGTALETVWESRWVPESKKVLLVIRELKKELQVSDD